MAKLRPEQLSAALQGALAPIYIVSGDEHLLVQETCDLIRHASKIQGYESRELYHVDPSFDWGTLHYASQSLGLFAEKKFIELRLTGKFNDPGRKALVEYSENPPADTVLLIVAPKLERNQLSSKWFTRLEKASRFIQIWPITAKQLPRWIDQRAQSLRLQLSRDAVALLASRVEGNLLAAAQELEKLSLLDAGRTIDVDTMAQAVADSARYDVFTLVDRALQGDSLGATRVLSGLKGEGTEVIALLWALAREIRTLLQLEHDISSGKNFQTSARRLGIWDSRQALVENGLRRLSKSQLQLLLRLAGQTDRAAKGMHRADPWDNCLELVLILSGVNSLSVASTRVALRA